METLKYIIKRLLLSLLILVGVSVIIYALARMMPTDFIDNQYQSALSQGTMTQADVDRIKEIYGLSMPDAFLSVTPGAGSDYKDVKFTRKTTGEDKYDVDIYKIYDENGNMTDEAAANLKDAYIKWYSDSYDAKGNLRLYLNADGTYNIYSVESRGSVVEGGDDEESDDEENTDDKLITLDEVLTLKESGTYAIVLGKGDVAAITMAKDGGELLAAGVNYHTATFWDKAGAVLGGYFTWLSNMLKGDLGMSFKYKKPVGEVIMQNMGISFGIALAATILQFLIAIPLGIKAATHQYGVIDYTVTVFAMIGISLPTFFLAALFIRIFALQLGWFPVGGAIGSLPIGSAWYVRLGSVLWHMALPMTVLVILSIGGLMRYTRTNTLEVLNADYIRTARAKGLSERTVVYKHAFRNTMIPLVTMLAGILPSLFGGAMITETVFSIPGIGQLAYQALIVADVPFIMGYNMFVAILTVLGTLFSDLMYAVVDPRVKLGR